MNPAPLLGTLLGTAVGDSLGLPYEGLSRRRVAAFGEIRHRLLFGRGLFSDDTEHSLMLASTLLSHHEEASRFQRAFAWKLRWWLLGLPAGVDLGIGHRTRRNERVQATEGALTEESKTARLSP